MTIRQEVSRLKMKYQTDDPYEICEYLDIQVMDRPMGKSPRSCKGFFLVSSRCKLIVINSDLPDSIQRIIIAHELGHAVLHSDSAINTFHEFAMFEDTNRMEYEANVFAAEFMLSDDTVLEALEMQMDFYQTAKCLYVPPELLDFQAPDSTMPRCKNHSSVYRAWGFPQARSGAAVELSMLSGEAYKVYVSVFVEHRSDGTMLPREIIWEDGQKYEIDRVIDIRPSLCCKSRRARRSLHHPSQWCKNISLF